MVTEEPTHGALVLLRADGTAAPLTGGRITIIYHIDHVPCLACDVCGVLLCYIRVDPFCVVHLLVLLALGLRGKILFA